jgi:hypothetical protein
MAYYINDFFPFGEEKSGDRIVLDNPIFIVIYLDKDDKEHVLYISKEIALAEGAFDGVSLAPYMRGVFLLKSDLDLFYLEGILNNSYIIDVKTDDKSFKPSKYAEKLLMGHKKRKY